MTLLINQTKVDLTLEHEVTVADLYRSLESWSLTQNHAVLGFLVDGVAPGPQELARKLELVATIELETVPAETGTSARLGVVLEVVELAKAATRAGDKAVLDDLRAEFPAIRATLLPLAKQAGRSAEKELALLDAAWDDLPRLAEALQHLERLTQQLRSGAGTPLQARQRALVQLGLELEKVEQLPLLWQKGKDKEALDQVVELLTLVEQLDALEPLSGPETAESGLWRAFRRDLQPFLAEVELALKAQDFVLLGDLIEYELAPRLRREHARQVLDFQLDR